MQSVRRLCTKELQFIINEKSLYKRNIPAYCRPIGVFSTVQMYSSFLFSGYMVTTAAPLVEVCATAGALSSFSSMIYFAIKMHNEKIITGVSSVGSHEKLVRLNLAGVVGEKSVIIRQADIRPQPRNDPKILRFKLGKTEYTIDMSKKQSADTKALRRLF